MGKTVEKPGKMWYNKVIYLWQDSECSASARKGDRYGIQFRGKHSITDRCALFYHYRYHRLYQIQAHKASNYEGLQHYAGYVGDIYARGHRYHNHHYKLYGLCYK